MSVRRPTFHESWYRVAGAQPRLRSTVQTSRQRFRGETYHVLRDPGANTFFRLPESTYRFVAKLDGATSVDEAWKSVVRTMGDAAPTQGEAVQALGQLFTSNLLDAGLPADTEAVLRRFRKRRRREVGQRVLGLLFARIPLVDPDGFLTRWTPAVSWLFGPVGFVLWVALMAWGALSLAGRLGELGSMASSVLRPDNLLLLYAATALSKAVHELGHGFACKRMGRLEGTSGEVRTLGVMLVALIPMPYVDATSAWSFRNKWRRVFVSAAGMYAELALAAVAAGVWAQAASGSALSAFCFNLMFIASVSTLLFNANPLIKFDGYFILADIAETPNLQQRAKEMAAFIWKKIGWGLRFPHRPDRTLPEAGLLMSYWAASSIYRVFLMVVILLFVADQLFFIGALMAVFGIVGFVVFPTVKMTHAVLVGEEAGQKRSRAVLSSGLAVAGLIALAALVPLPDHERAEGVVEPARFAVLRAATPLKLEGAALEARPVAAGEVVALGLNPDLRAEAAKLEAELRQRLAERQRVAPDETALALVLDERIEATMRRVAEVQLEIEALRIAAPIAGAWTPSDPAARHGASLPEGEEVGRVIDIGRPVIRVAADQYAGPRIAEHHAAGAHVEMRLHGRPEVLIPGRVVAVLPAGQRQLPSEALGFMGGGAIAVDSESQEGGQAAEPYFQVLIEPDLSAMAQDGEDVARLLSGQRVVVRFRFDDTPLLAQAYRSARQLLQERFAL